MMKMFYKQQNITDELIKLLNRTKMLL